MGVALDQENGASVLRLDGAVDISAAAELKVLLLEAIATGNAIHVSVGAVTELDVTAFQLLWAARREAERAGLELVFTGSISEGIEGALDDVGLGGVLLPASTGNFRDSEAKD